MSPSLNIGGRALPLGYATSLAAGRMRFKHAALTTPVAGGAFQKRANLAANPAFILAIALYAALSAFWVWLLTRASLSQAYPFVALAFMLTLIAGGVVFGDPATPRLLIGGALVLGGLLVIAG